MSKIYESDIEQLAIEQLKPSAIAMFKASISNPNGIKPLRAYSQVLLQNNVLKAIATINTQLIPNNDLKPISVSAKITNSPHPIMSANNLAFCQWCSTGKIVCHE